MRRRNWLALAVGTVVITFSYFTYAAATAIPGQIDVALTGVALAIAPFAFVAVGFISRNPRAPRRVLRAMGLLLLLGLAGGLLSPILGAAAGFGVGTALTLNEPDHSDVLRNRLVAVGFVAAYMLLLLVVATPAGVMTGALLPPIIIGFADEFTAWRASRRT
ncbi:MAG: hypothetical protein ACLFWM_04155 [Actinomycetota bacterium]